MFVLYRNLPHLLYKIFNLKMKKLSFTLKSSQHVTAKNEKKKKKTLFLQIMCAISLPEHIVFT